MKMVLESVPYSDIAAKYGYSKDTVARYVKTRLRKDVAKGVMQSRKKLTSDFMRTLSYLQGKAEKVIEACDEWLRRPGKSGKYTLDPRADEITVVYKAVEIDEATGKEKEVKKEATLQDLIDGRQDIVSLKYKYSDPRALIISALAEARKQTELIAKVTGELKQISESVDVYGDLIPAITKAIMAATFKDPEAKKEIIESIKSEILAVEDGDEL